MFFINTDDIKKLEGDLHHFARRAVPFATKKTLNDSAFAAMSIARTDIKRTLINRNRFTAQSIQVDPARTLNISRQSATVGSTADYMETQEFGGIKTKTRKEGVGITTSYASGEGENAQPRSRLPRKANSMASIKLSKRRNKGNGRKQRNLVSIQQAASTGRKFVFLDLGKTQGIFKVIGGKRRPKIKMVRDMTRQSVVIPRNPWLRPAFDEALRMQPAFYADALRFQIRRGRLFR